MARDVVTTTGVPAAGVADSGFTAPTVNNDVCDVGGILVVRNGSGASITVTIQTPGDVEGLAIAENALVIAAGDVGSVFLDSTVYARPKGSADAGKAYVDYSAVASVERAVLAVS